MSQNWTHVNCHLVLEEYTPIYQTLEDAVWLLLSPNNITFKLHNSCKCSRKDDDEKDDQDRSGSDPRLAEEMEMERPPYFNLCNPNATHAQYICHLWNTSTLHHPCFRDTFAILLLCLQCVCSVFAIHMQKYAIFPHSICFISAIIAIHGSYITIFFTPGWLPQCFSLLFLMHHQHILNTCIIHTVHIHTVLQKKVHFCCRCLRMAGT